MPSYAISTRDSPHPDDIAVIRELYEGNQDQERFQHHLEQSLLTGCRMIVIEPITLGDVTARWILVGNCLHLTSFSSALASAAVGLLWSDRPAIYFSLAGLSACSSALYLLCWQSDPCCQYRVNSNTGSVLDLPMLRVKDDSFNGAVVLVKKPHNRGRFLHCFVSVLAVAFCGWRWNYS